MAGRVTCNPQWQKMLLNFTLVNGLQASGDAPNPVSASDWCALQEPLYKCIDTIQYNTIQYIAYNVHAHKVHNYHQEITSLIFHIWSTCNCTHMGGYIREMTGGGCPEEISGYRLNSIAGPGQSNALMPLLARGHNNLNGQLKHGDRPSHLRW